MHAIIGGCGRVGAELAEQLSGEGHDVVVIDNKAAAFERLGSAFNGDVAVDDVTDKDALVRAGIERAGAFLAVTSADNVNLMAVQIAQELFAVPRTVARLFNPRREDSYRKMGVHYVSGTRLVTQALLNEIHADLFPAHVPFGQSDVEVVEMTATREGHGVTVAELEREGDVRVAAIRREGRIRLPRPGDTVLGGDLVIAAVTHSAHRHLRGLMCGPSTAAAGARPEAG